MPDSFVGTATMSDDGTLVLLLRAVDDDGVVGDARVTYAPSDPDYDRVLQHLGGLKPGESTRVRPWPDE